MAYFSNFLRAVADGTAVPVRSRATAAFPCAWQRHAVCTVRVTSQLLSELVAENFTHRGKAICAQLGWRGPEFRDMAAQRRELLGVFAATKRAAFTLTLKPTGAFRLTPTQCVARPVFKALCNCARGDTAIVGVGVQWHSLSSLNCAGCAVVSCHRRYGRRDSCRDSPFTLLGASADAAIESGVIRRRLLLPPQPNHEGVDSSLDGIAHRRNIGQQQG